VSATRQFREPAEGYVPVPGAELYFREIGDGQPIAVLHGGPDFNHHYLLPELDRLSDAFRLLYYDQRGRGKSSKGVAPETLSIESEVDDLDRLRQHFGLDAFALLGHSWGSLLAMEYATRHADRLCHLILMNPAPASHADLLHFRESRQTNEAGTLTRMRAIASTPQYLDGDIEAEAEYYRMHYGKAVFGSDHVATIVARLRVHFTAESIVQARAIEERLYAQTWRASEYDLPARLRKLSVPTLVIHGDHDFVPMECSKHIVEALPAARLVVLRDCGHFSYLERPAELAGAIADFMLSR
jgi:proline iminopeptidase